MNTAILTPLSNQSPAVVSVQKELSGDIWVSRFPGSASPSDLMPPFRHRVEAFLMALKEAGASVVITSTFRPRQRTYMMHWSYRIYKLDFDPAHVPAMPGVYIEWVHETRERSRAAAEEMARAFGIAHLGVAPALQSLHTVRQAIDMVINWSGVLPIKDSDGNLVNINTLPRSGMNAQLKTVGRSYGVMKFVGGASDKPHWSTTGH